MKQVLYAFMVFCAFGLLSCRKSSDDFTIKQHDDDQIQSYIKANNLTGMVHDASDTSGIYYQLITAGSGKVFTYPDEIAFLYSAKSFDGGYNNTDTILNHVYNYTAYVGPAGLQYALRNIVKRKGAKYRVLVPSRLAYGVNGTTITRYISATATSTATINGNQCLDFTVSVLDNDVVNSVDKIAAYDDISIRKFLNAKGLLSNFTKIDTGKYAGLYYRITKTGTGTSPIKTGSVLGVQYTGYMLNDAVAEQWVTEGYVAATTLFMYDDGITPKAFLGALPNVTAGADISIVGPSKLFYGIASVTQNSFALPAFSCLHYEMSVITVSN